MKRIHDSGDGGRPKRPVRLWGLRASLLVVAVIASAGWATDLPEGVDPVPTVFGPGEKMTYKIGYGLINAGEGTLEVVGLVNYQGQTCYELVSKANSNRFFSSFYKVRDKITSYMDVETLYTRYFHKRLREGDYKKTVEISFDHMEQVAHYADGRKFDIETGIQDVLSAVFFVRNLDLGAGDRYSLVAHSSRKTYDLQIIIHGRETVAVEAGTFDCWVVEPVLEGEGLFKHEGKITMYVTADHDRVPVLIKTKVPVGSIDVELKEYRPGRPLRERPAFTR